MLVEPRRFSERHVGRVLANLEIHKVLIAPTKKVVPVMKLIPSIVLALIFSDWLVLALKPYGCGTRSDIRGASGTRSDI